MIVCPMKDLGRYAALIPGLEEALSAVSAITDMEPRVIPLSGGSRILVQSYVTVPVEQGRTEAHRKFLDVQYVVEGEEYVGWADVATLTPDGEFDTAKDVGFYTGHTDLLRIGAGHCYVVFPEDAHLPGITPAQPQPVKKLVLKLAL